MTSSLRSHIDKTLALLDQVTLLVERAGAPPPTMIGHHHVQWKGGTARALADGRVWLVSETNIEIFVNERNASTSYVQPFVNVLRMYNSHYAKKRKKEQHEPRSQIYPTQRSGADQDGRTPSE